MLASVDRAKNRQNPLTVLGRLNGSMKIRTLIVDDQLLARELLRRLLKEHGENPRASLAAFTLGRVLLVELDKPIEAAKVFADLRARAPGGVFAEDALAREVEAWKRAGERDTARARAEEYLRLYPNGNRTDRVKAAGGIE